MLVRFHIGSYLNFYSRSSCVPHLSTTWSCNPREKNKKHTLNLLWHSKVPTSTSSQIWCICDTHFVMSETITTKYLHHDTINMLSNYPLQLMVKTSTWRCMCVHDHVCFPVSFSSSIHIEEEFKYFVGTSSGTGGFLVYLEPQYVHRTAPNPNLLWSMNWHYCKSDDTEGHVNKFWRKPQPSIRKCLYRMYVFEDHQIFGPWLIRLQCL